MWQGDLKVKIHMCVFRKFNFIQLFREKIHLKKIFMFIQKVFIKLLLYPRNCYRSQMYQYIVSLTFSWLYVTPEFSSCLFSVKWHLFSVIIVFKYFNFPLQMHTKQINKSNISASLFATLYCVIKIWWGKHNMLLRYRKSFQQEINLC